MDVAGCCLSVISALKILHKNGLVHGNLSLWDLQVVGGNIESLNIANYGWGAFSTQDKAHSAVLSPEVLLGNTATTRTDVWNLGMLLYMMLVGYIPFDLEEMQHKDAADVEKMHSQIKAGEIPYAPLYWGSISEEAKTLVQRMLVADPQKRLTLAQVEDDYFLTAPSTSMQHMPETGKKFQEISEKKYGR